MNTIRYIERCGVLLQGIGVGLMATTHPVVAAALLVGSLLLGVVTCREEVE